MSSRRFCLTFLIFVVSGLAAIATLNLGVDPYGQYGVGILDPVVAQSRHQKVDLFLRQETKPEALILGSSRVLKIEPDYVTEKLGVSCFNAGVNHGRPTDFVAFCKLYQSVWNDSPKVVVIGVDVAAFSNHVPEDARLLSEPRLARLAPEWIRWQDRLATVTDLVTFKQTISTFNSLRLAFYSAYDPTHDYRSKKEMIRDDGLIIYHERENQIKAGAYDFKSSLDFNKREHQLIFNRMESLSRSEMQALTTLVQVLRRQSCQVYLFVTPYHPDLIADLERTKYFIEREDETVVFLTKLAKASESIFADLRRIRSFDGQSNEFVDGVHPLEPNTRRLIDHLISIREGGDHAVQ